MNQDIPGAISDTGRQTIKRTQGAAVGAAGVLSAVVGFVVLLIAARLLPLEANTRFSLFWSVFLVLCGLAAGVNMEMTRSVTVSGVSSRPDGITRTPKVAVVGAIAIIAVLLLAGGSLPAWRLSLPTLGEQAGWWVCLAIVLGFAGNIGQCSFIGALAGVGQWSLYALVITVQSLSRLVFVIAAALSGAGLVGFAYAAVTAEFMWVIIVLLSKDAKTVLAHMIDASGLVFFRRVLVAMAGQGANAVLMVGFPWLLSLTTESTIFLKAAPLVLAMSLTRAPLMVPITALSGVAVSYFAGRSSSRGRVVVAILGVLVAAGCVIAVVVALVGPWFLRFINPSYIVSGTALFGLTMGAVCLAGLAVTGLLCQSSASYATYISGWLVAIIVAIAVLFMPFGLEARAIWALVCGPVAGVLVHLFFLMRPARTRA